MLMSCAASRCGNAVASSGTRAIAPPKQKIGTELIGEVMLPRWVQMTSMTSSVSGPRRCDFQ